MSDLRDLYQEVILDHSRSPRNFRKIPSANHSAEGFNPLCGDRITVFLTLRNGKVEDVSFQGSGCAISTASASMMTEKLKGKTPEEAKAIFESFHSLITGRQDSSGADLGKLAVFSGVSEFPIRIKCAALAWHALKAALEGKEHTVSTE
ncbi:MAG TPA: SUF system NifU family Fe-S cluster assembly protein [Candidatus Polarisedimenticolia bacterium]|jgi:nitrogen fixation NifU-like protein|nr:SUF system NifU family Fe-S cluster assembly protein [Candidatus Polarisedimenticolia bacterium]